MMWCGEATYQRCREAEGRWPTLLLKHKRAPAHCAWYARRGGGGFGKLPSLPSHEHVANTRRGTGSGPAVLVMPVLGQTDLSTQPLLSPPWPLRVTTSYSIDALGAHTNNGVGWLILARAN